MTPAGRGRARPARLRAVRRTPTAGRGCANCPFHKLAAQYPDIVCGMNLALIGGLIDGLGRELRAGARTAARAMLRRRSSEQEWTSL